MNKTNTKELEAIRDYLDKMIDEADALLASWDEEIAESEQRIDELIKAREELKRCVEARKRWKTLKTMRGFTESQKMDAYGRIGKIDF